MDKKPITIKAISEQAGVSVATVSRVINQNGRFSKETEEKILSIIKDSGYQPNELARGLRLNRAKVVGVIIPDITNDFFARITLEVQKNLLRKDYVSIICNTDESKEMEQIHYNLLKNQRVSGMIVAGQGVSSVNKPDVPTIYLDRSVGSGKETGKEENESLCISSDNRRGGYLATKELLDSGCQNICIVCFSKQPIRGNFRFLGYADALKESGQEVDEKRVFVTANGCKDIGYDITRRILRECPEVDGIFYTTDILAIGGLQAAGEAGISVPGQLKIVGFDDSMISSVVNPPLTTVHQDVDEIARRAVDLLISLVEHKEVKCRTDRVPVRLVKRKTT